MYSKTRKKIEKGFTLIELLVVIAIISILSSILFAFINPKKQLDLTTDTKRLVQFRNIEQALDLYFLDHNHYPGKGTYVSFDTLYNSQDLDWFLEEIKPYMPSDIVNYNGDGSAFGSNRGDYFVYKSGSGDNFTTYGMAEYLRDQKYKSLMENDGGFNSYWYEKGSLPRYCKNKYESPGDDWSSATANHCRGGM